jgi:RNA polymerase sigma-70 factor (family 1)
LTAQKSNILPEEERQLLHSVAAGDNRAFRMLVDIFWSKVYGNVLTIVKSPQTAEEITQDIFLKIWQQKEKLYEVQSFKHYIYVVGRNQVISQLRKKMAGKLAEPSDILEERLTPDEQLQYKETYRLVLEGIAKLTPQQQLVFKMSRLEGMSYEEIGGRLGLSKNTVKGHMVLALNFLRMYFRDHANFTITCFLLLQSILQK